MLKKTLFLFSAFLLTVIAAHAERREFVELVSFRVEQDVSGISLNHETWKKVKPYRQPLQPQFLVVPKPTEIGVKELFVQSVNDGKYICFRLIWKDPTKDETPRIMDFSDGAAIQFPVNRGAFPEFFMGEEKKPVHILHWKAWRGRDKKSGYQTTKTAYPNMTTDIYTFDYPIKGKGIGKSQAEKDIFIPGRAAQNPLSFPTKRTIMELSSTGPGTITFKKTINTSGDSEWKEGEWTVVFRRPLTVDDAGSAQFEAGEKIPVAFAVWEGSRMESGGRKAVSPSWAEVEVAK